MKLSIFFPRSGKNFAEIFMGIALNQYIAFWRISLFPMLILHIQEPWKSFHFLVSSSISFLKNLKFFLNRSFTSLVSVTAKYFTLFVAIEKGDVSLISQLCYHLYIGRILIFFSLFCVLLGRILILS